MLGVLSFLTILMPMLAGVLQATALFALLATFMLPAISFYENRETYFGIADRHYVGRNIIGWALIRSLGHGAVASFAAYGFGIIARQIWL